MCTGSCSATSSGRPAFRLGLLVWLFFAFLVPCVKGSVVEIQLSPRAKAIDAKLSSNADLLELTFPSVCEAIQDSSLPADKLAAACESFSHCHWSADNCHGHATDADHCDAVNSTSAFDMIIEICDSLFGCHWHVDTCHGEHDDGGDHDHDHDDENTLPHVIGAAVVVLAVGGVGVALPFFLRSHRATDIFLANAFGCGALVAFGIVHLLPESVAIMADEGMDMTIGSSSLPLAYVLCVMGLLLAGFLDSLSHPHQLDTADDDSCTADVESASSASAHAATKAADVLLVAGLFLHSVFEGIVIGAAHGVLLVWVSTLSVVFHKWAAGVALAQAMLSRGQSRRFVIGLLTLFVVASPIGVGIGAIVTTGGMQAVGPVNAFCAGLVIHLGAELFSAFHAPMRKRVFAAGWFVCIAAAGIIVGLMAAHLSQHHH